MKVSVFASIRLDYGDTIDAGVDLPHDVARSILKPINVTDEPFLAGPLGVGDTLQGTVEHKKELQIRKNAIDNLATALSKHLIEQLEKRDTFNGYTLQREEDNDYERK